MKWFHETKSELRSNRKRLNCCGILVAIVVPWILFIAVFGLMSFSMRYHFPVPCFLLLALLFVITVGGSALLAYVSQMRKIREPDDENEPMWYWFLCVTCLLAIVCGTVAGSINYGSNMRTCYDMENLAMYYDVNPGLYVGQQMVDAGRINFARNTFVDVTKSMGFKDSDMYCVAPIVNQNMTLNTFHDFWVVGINCCSGKQADFHCTGYNNPNYYGGLRLMNDAERPFYRLAVQQAEATYKISTRKPLFFVRSTDTEPYVADLHRLGRNMFAMGIITALVVQCVLVLIGCLAFAKHLDMR